MRTAAAAVLAALAVLAVSQLAACGGSTAADGTAPAVQGGTLTVLWPAEPLDLSTDSGFGLQMISGSIKRLAVFDALVAPTCRNRASSPHRCGHRAAAGSAPAAPEPAPGARRSNRPCGWSFPITRSPATTRADTSAIVGREQDYPPAARRGITELAGF
ncbi:hypothetical protein BBK14_26475 [Parafrankia soli]|uniref:Solute-binding protein family 5 domain-containing protein n=1 Tax=Parafrankia soli TaxID=2599596 RepID=A0A1S1PEW5_9ACTN|nr:hypothetical protein BBK14_26475 [Parafrankia soli]